MTTGVESIAMATERNPDFFKKTGLKVGVVGCGYVGLPLGLRFAEAGHHVVGFDTDPGKVDKLNRGKSYIGHIPDDKVQQHVSTKRFSATTDFAKIKEMDAVVICERPKLGPHFPAMRAEIARAHWPRKICEYGLVASRQFPREWAPTLPRRWC